MAELPVSSVGDGLPLSQDEQEVKPLVAVAHIDDARRTSQVSPVSSETMDMDLQSSPSSSEADDDEIPGLVTGSVSRRPGPPVPPRQPSPLTLPPPRPVHAALPALTIPSPVSGVSSSMEQKETRSVTPPSSAGVLPRRVIVKNPFVSGGFMTEFVGKRESLTTQRVPASKDAVEPESSGSKTVGGFVALLDVTKGSH